VIINELKEPITDRALISNGFYEPITDRFNFCNRLSLMYVTKNSCNVHSRSPLLEILIGNGRCGGKPRGQPTALMGNGHQTTTFTEWVHATSVKDPLQMLHDLFEVFMK
jgi:hypothetical protein